MKIKIIQNVDEWEYSVRNCMSDYSIVYGSIIVVEEGIREFGYGDELRFHYNIIKENNREFRINVLYESDDSSYVYSIGETIKVGNNYHTIKNKINNVNGEVEYIVESATVEPENKDQILENLYKEQESLIEKYEQRKEEEAKSNIVVETEPTNKKSLYNYVGELSVLGISVSVIVFFVWVLVSL